MVPMNDAKPIRVLMIEDDEEDYFLVKDLFIELPARDYTITWLSEYGQGLKRLNTNSDDVCLLDYRLDARTGIELLREARQAGCTVPVILLTGQGEWEVDQLAMTSGASDYIDKSRLDATMLERAIRYAIQHKRYESELERQVEERTHDLATINKQLSQEIVERRRAEEAIRLADQRKDDYLATLGHQLRNPLAPILHSLDLLQFAEQRPEIVGRVKTVVTRQTQQLIRLVDELLDVSRISNSRMNLSIEQADLAEIMTLCVEQNLGNFQAKGITLHQPTIPAGSYLECDPVRITQSVSNLLSNAAAFSKVGGNVWLSCEITQEKVRIIIQDSGPGIPLEFHEAVFELFSPVSRKLKNPDAGLGVGLALVKHIADQHQGSITLVSDDANPGAKFILSLPRRQSSAA